MRSIYISLPDGTAERLWELARRELRAPKAQAAVLILDGLRLAGFPVEPDQPERVDVASEGVASRDAKR